MPFAISMRPVGAMFAAKLLPALTAVGLVRMTLLPSRSLWPFRSLRAIGFGSRRGACLPGRSYRGSCLIAARRWRFRPSFAKRLPASLLARLAPCRPRPAASLGTARAPNLDQDGLRCRALQRRFRCGRLCSRFRLRRGDLGIGRRRCGDRLHARLQNFFVTFFAGSGRGCFSRRYVDFCRVGDFGRSDIFHR